MNEIVKILETMEYGPAPEEDGHVRAWLKRHGGRFGHFIDGKLTKPGKETFAVNNPADGEKLADVAEAGEKEVDAAVRAATARLCLVVGTERHGTRAAPLRDRTAGAEACALPRRAGDAR